MAEIFHIVISELVAAEGDPVAETSTYQMLDSLPAPVPPKKVTGREEYEMLEKTFTILTSLAAAAASADDDEFRKIDTFIANKL